MLLIILIVSNTLKAGQPSVGRDAQTTARPTPKPFDELKMEILNSEDAEKHYESLDMYAQDRYRQISDMSKPFMDITDRYGRLISRVVFILGNIKPDSTQDIVLRDLLADIFDCLYEARHLIMATKLNIAFPVARRAYETLSLMNLCAIHSEWAEKWHKGKQISNATVRKELGKHPMGAQQEALRKLYSFFCLATHPNREMIPYRFLGDGNQYVLGVIGQPNLLMICDYCIKILEMWYWFGAMVSFFYRNKISKIYKSYFEYYMQTAKEAGDVNKWLVENYNRLLEEEKKSLVSKIL